MSAAIVQPVTDILVRPLAQMRRRPHPSHADTACTDGARVQLNGRLSEHCRKKAALCLARIFRKLPPEANVISPHEWCPHFRTLIVNPFSPGPQLAIMGLVTTVLERSTEGYEELQGLIVQALAATVTGRNVRKDYLYYGIPCPWLQCKCAPPLFAFLGFYFTFSPRPAYPVADAPGPVWWALEQRAGGKGEQQAQGGRA